jgi:hypothetical protein
MKAIITPAIAPLPVLLLALSSRELDFDGSKQPVAGGLEIL